MATISAVSSTDSVVWVRKASAVGVGGRDAFGVGRGLDQGHPPLGHLAERADHLGMAGMADEQYVAAALDQPLGLAVDLGDERAGRVEIVEAALLPPWPGPPWARRARRRPPARRPGTSSSSGDEHRALGLEAVDDELVVDDLVADIDRRAVALERELDDPDRAVDAGAEAARRRDQQGEGGLGVMLLSLGAGSTRSLVCSGSPGALGMRPTQNRVEDLALRPCSVQSGRRRACCPSACSAAPARWRHPG